VKPHEGEALGQAVIDIEVVNSSDLDRVLDGTLDEGGVRSVVVRDALMDTGATHLCLPLSLIEQLGLQLSRVVPVETAVGDHDRRVYRNAMVRFEDREAEVEAIELPDGVRPLLGAVPMELLGIEPDVHTRTVRKLRMDHERSYITIR